MRDTKSTMLPEHADNPFVAGLGAPQDFGGHLRLLRRKPAFAEHERGLPHHLRRYCVLRVLDYIDPLDCQIELAERIGMAIRQGYKWRDPAKGLHHAAILESVERLERGKLDYVSGRELESNASGFALLGHPGMGKTLTVNRVLNSFPSVLTPQLPYFVKQIPCLRVECPPKGTSKQFSVYVLKAIDRRIGTRYFDLFGSGSTGDTLILHVQNLLQVHAVGLLVIDELQHLNESNEGTKPLMNYLVTLINTVGIPVLLVGTMGAARIVQEDFREARRATGFGSPVWTRLTLGTEWEALLTGLWKYQWTANVSPLTPEISRAIHQETQGIIDLVIRLFMLVQFRAIYRGEVEGKAELIDAGLVLKVAHDEFTLVRPMIDALRAGKESDVDRYPDLTALHRHMEVSLSRSAGIAIGELRMRTEERVAAAGVADARDPMAALRIALEKRGLDNRLRDEVLATVGRACPNGDLFELTEAAREAISALKGCRPGSRRGGSPAKVEEDTKDLRHALRIAKESGRTCHAVLSESGVVAPVATVLTA